MNFISKNHLNSFTPKSSDELSRIIKDEGHENNCFGVNEFEDCDPNFETPFLTNEITHLQNQNPVILGR